MTAQLTGKDVLGQSFNFQVNPDPSLGANQLAGNALLQLLATAFGAPADGEADTGDGSAIALLKAIRALLAQMVGSTANQATTSTAIQTGLSLLATHADAVSENSSLAAVQTLLGTLATHQDATAQATALGTLQTLLGTLATHQDATAGDGSLAQIVAELQAALPLPAGAASAANQASEISALTSLLASVGGIADAEVDTGAGSAIAILKSMRASLTQLAGAAVTEEATLTAIQAAQGVLATHADAVASNTTLAAMQTILGTLATHQDATSQAAALGSMQSLLGTLATHADAVAGDGSLAQIVAELQAALPLPTGSATAVNQATANTSLAGLLASLGGVADAEADSGPGSAIALLKSIRASLITMAGVAASQEATLQAIQAAQGVLETHADAVAGNATLTAMQTILGTLATHQDATAQATALGTMQTLLATLGTHADATAGDASLAQIVAELQAALPLPSGAATSALQSTGNAALASILTALGLTLRVAAPKAEATSASGMITTGGQPQQLFAAGALINGFAVQNPSTAPGSIWIRSMGSAGTPNATMDTNSLEIPPGGYYEPPHVSTYGYSIIGGTTGMPFYGRVF